MKSYFFLLLTICTHNLIAQQADTVINRIDANGKKVGKWIEYNFYEGDSLKSIYHYTNGLLDGKAITYYPNKTIESITIFKNGEKQGKSRSFYETGVISDIFLFKNDETILHFEFDPQGRLFQETDEGKIIHYHKGKLVQHL